MRFLKTGVLVLIAMLAASGVALAQGAVTGTMVGDPGGAHMTWDLVLPAATDVTLTLDHWPCQTGDAITFSVWGADGPLAMSEEATACSQTAAFNTGAGGPATLKVSNYLAGVGTWYSLMAEGIDLPGAAPMAVEETAAVAAPVEGEMVVKAKAVEAPVAAPVVAAPVVAAPVVAAAAVPGVIVENATVLGDVGGAYGTHKLTAEEGKTYTVTMVYGTDPGGSWKGVGFKVWGPDGQVAAGEGELHDTTTKTATFTADAAGEYTVQVYNYHPGVVLFYSLTATNE